MFVTPEKIKKLKHALLSPSDGEDYNGLLIKPPKLKDNTSIS